MTPTTLVMAYYENPGMLQEQYRNLLSLPDALRDLLHVIIVDDGSPRYPAEPVDLHGINLQIYRMKQDIRWNQDACRNIGVRHAETTWVLLTDIDHMIPVKTWNCVLTRNWDEKIAYYFARVSAPDMQPYKVHPNTWYLSRARFEECGGYDERFAGYYGTDADFRDRLTRTITRTAMIKENIIRVPRTLIADASTTTYLRKQPEDREAINRIKIERAAIDGWVPLRYQFSYDRVWPQEVKS